MNDELFKYINPFLNNNLSSLKGKDLRYFLILLDKYYLKLRNNIGLEEKITFGLELEYENIKNYHIFETVDFIRSKLKKTNWISKYDSSLNMGLEINSSILNDNWNNWKILDNLCELLKDYVSVGSKSGGHIHIGTQVLGNNKDNWLHLLKLWSVYENIIYHFAYGEFLTGRKSIVQYAQPMKDKFWEYSNSLKNNDISTIIDFLKKTKRHQAINFWNVKKEFLNECVEKNTIEFRSPNSSLESVIWQNNVNFFAKMLIYCKSSQFNNDILDNRWDKNNFLGDSINLYDEIFLDQALELCDMIFDNNLDKIYFLKQYLKSFEINKEKYFGDYQELVKKKKEVKSS